MTRYVKSMRWKSVTLPTNVFYAPLAGCSDFAFRHMASFHPVGLMFCEMVRMEALVRNIGATYRMLAYRDSMRPIGAQLCGSNPRLAAPTARIIEELGFDTVDLNCGCPVDKVTKDGSGSGLLKTPLKIGEIVAEMVAAVEIPVTLKIRAGWDDAHINAPEITRIAESAGAVAIAVHGRTREQQYRGKADRGVIRKCKEAASSIAVIGNGDVFSPEEGRALFEETGCDAVLVSRGTLGKPWIAEDIVRFDKGLPPLKIDDATLFSYLLDHLRSIEGHEKGRKALLDARRVSCWFLRSRKEGKEVRGRINRLEEVGDIIRLVEELCAPVAIRGV
ncbi:MAG: tRNA dihydrouridine synthase DusB [Simkaniaceae bacterium]|nr:tRNA dihydrouridine synthase DusB [Simkaniaceae bacterium]